MSESEEPIFLTAIPDEQPIRSIIINEDDDIDIDIKSSAESEETSRVNEEIEETLKKKPPEEYSVVLVPHPINEALQDKM